MYVHLSAWEYEVFVWLKSFNAELSPKIMYWRRLRAHEVGEEGLYLTLVCHRQNDSCIKMGSEEN